MDIALPRKRRGGAYLGGLVALLALAGVTLGVSRLRHAAPRVSRAAIWIDTVRRGELVREVSAPGSLVSDDVRIVTARASGTVDRVHVKPGTAVAPDTLLLELSNPDLEFSALEAATEVKAARAELLDVQAALGIQRIEQRTKLEAAKVEYREAKRRSEAIAPLAEQAVVASLDAEQLRERAGELEQRIRLEEEHVQVLQAGGDARAAAQRARVEGLRAQADLRAAQVEALRVYAGAAGLLAELGVEVGERVALGSVLGKVIDPKKLKAELRVPEAQARDIAVGQPVTITVQAEDARGRVTRIDPGVQEGAVKVEVTFEGSLPAGARLDLSVDGRIELARVANAVYTGKPASGGEQSTVSLFKLLADGRTAVRVPVKIGRTSVTAAEVLSGLAPGDRVILSDMSEWSDADRIELE
jgi:multidrug resistance efflux pump